MIGTRVGRALVAAVLAVAIATGAHAQSQPDPATPPQERRDAPSDLVALPIDELRARANANDIAAMEELGRRLIQGTTVTKDPQAGAGWLLRAADLGSPQSAFNVGVMYERGFVVGRNSAKAAEWYRKAADAGLAVAKHNLALLLRDGKGVARDGTAAIELLKSAAQQGLAASMFSLGDIYDRGDAAPRDAVAALAWFAVAAEFERRLNGGTETELAKAADQRAQTLQRTLTPQELARAQDRARGEFRLISEAMRARKSAPASPPEAQVEPPPAAEAPPAPAPSPAAADVAWPSGAADQVRLVQQLLFDLKLLTSKPDGSIGPVTRAAIRDFQKGAGLRQTGEVSKDLFLALKSAHATRDVVANSPLPSPAKVETPAAPKPEEPKPSEPEPSESKPQASAEPPAATTPAPPTPAPSSGDIARGVAKSELPRLDAPNPPAPEAERPLDIGRPLPPPAPPSSSEFARLSSPPPDPDAWPSSRVDQVKAIQAMLREMKIYRSAIDGIASTGTKAAIREYEQMAGLKVTGEPSKAVFESLKEMRSLMGGKR